MRLKQATEVANEVNAITVGAAPAHQQQEQQVPTTEAEQRQSQQNQVSGKTALTALPPTKTLVRTAILSAVYGIVLGVSLPGLLQIDQYHFAWDYAALIRLVSRLVFIALPLLLAFWQGYGQRDSRRTMALCCVLAGMIFLNSNICLAFVTRVSLSELAAPTFSAQYLYRDFAPWPLYNVPAHLLPSFIAGVMLVVGLLGGALGQGAQQLAARSRKNNR